MTSTALTPVPSPDENNDARLGPIAQLSAHVDAVRALIAAGLLNPAALGLTASEPAAAKPVMVPGERITIRDLAAKTRLGLTEGTMRTYGTYLTFLDQGWPAEADAADKLYPGLGDKWADEVLAADLEEALRWVGRRAQLGAHRRAEVREAIGRRVRESDGSGAEYNAVGAWRAMFDVAVRNRHLAKGFDPAQEVAKPQRKSGSRLPLEQAQMNQMWAVVENTGNDPELDALICKTILIAGARREGLTNLTLGGIDHDECTILLIEKGKKGMPKKKVHQPVPDWFIDELYSFAVSRGATRPGDQVFRTRGTKKRPPQPITDRRLDYLFQRIQTSLPWADRKQVTAHVLRHHAIAVVQAASRRAVSLAFARHEPEGTHDLYGQATPKEVARVVVKIYGGDHPWLHREDLD